MLILNNSTKKVLTFNENKEMNKVMLTRTVLGPVKLFASQSRNKQ